MLNDSSVSPAKSFCSQTFKSNIEGKSAEKSIFWLGVGCYNICNYSLILNCKTCKL